MVKIGVYDSGIGGFTVIDKILSEHINTPLVYYGDALNNPWGNKSAKELKEILNKVAAFFNSKGVTHIVTGCNTTVSLFKNELSAIFNRPIITLFDGTINNYNNSQYSILSTENSSKNRLFSEFLLNANISQTNEISCPNLASLIESNKKQEATELLNSYLDQTKYDTVILGCTHYPLIINNIQTTKKIINPASFLKLPFKRAQQQIQNTIDFYTSGNKERFKNQIDAYLNLSTFILNDIKIDSITKEVQSSTLIL